MPASFHEKDSASQETADGLGDRSIRVHRWGRDQNARDGRSAYRRDGRLMLLRHRIWSKSVPVPEPTRLPQSAHLKSFAYNAFAPPTRVSLETMTEERHMQ